MKTGAHVNTDLTEEDVAWLAKGGPFPSKITVVSGGDQREYVVEDRDALGYVAGVDRRCGKKGFVLFVRDPKSDERLAAKFCLPADYQGEREPNLEVRLATKLKPFGRAFSIPHFSGIVEAIPEQPDEGHDWVCFVSEWVDGDTLRHWLTEWPDRLTPQLACQIIRELVISTRGLTFKKLKHDDLHAGNLMLRPEDPEVMRSRGVGIVHTLCIIDTGSLKPTAQSTSKPHDDWSRVAKIVSQLHNAIFRNRPVATQHPGFLALLREYCQKLLEPEKARAFPTDNSYIEPLDDMERELRESRPSAKVSFTPFDAISAEYLASDKLLRDLFVSSLPWMREVLPARPTVITGPRGCGKSMLLRYLSAKVHLTGPDSSAEFLDDIPFVGVYISCSSDLTSHVLWLAHQKEKALKKQAGLTTLFNLLVARELFRLLDRVLNAQAASDRLGITTDRVQSLVQFCREYLGEPEAVPSLRVTTIAGDFADELDRLRRRVGRELPHSDTSSPELPASFIRELSLEATRLFAGLTTRPLVFLLDDYTSHRIPTSVQLILNPIIFSRQAEHYFKVSSEKFGFEPSAYSGWRIDQNREYQLVDTGAWVLDVVEGKDKKRFLSALLDRRFEIAGYDGRTKTLIGKSDFRSDADMARKIREQKKGQSFHYHGLSVLSNLWSGDLATILHMVGSMCNKAGVVSTSTQTISQRHQHEAIIAVSQGLVEQVRAPDQFGEAMRLILESYARMAKDLLVAGVEKPLKKGGALAPQRTYRFEMTKEGPYDLFARLAQVPGTNGQLADLARDLLRRSVFIDLGPSRGKEGKSTETVRWQLRSSLLPNFGLSLKRFRYIDVKGFDDFVMLLTEPDKFRQTYTAKYKGLSKSAAPLQLDAFND